MFNSEQLEKKWAPILEAQDAPKFKDNYRKSITAVLLENQEKALKEENSQAAYLSEGNTIGAGTVKLTTRFLFTFAHHSRQDKTHHVI